jgi:twitching motility two-component system response regulator PilH
VLAAGPRDTVLIVEDDVTLRTLYRAAFLTAGYAAVAVGDGLDALRRLEADRPSAVVLDLALPRIGGRDVHRELRARPETRDVPVVVVTGTDASDLDHSDFASILHKPVHLDMLVTIVDQCLRRGAHRGPFLPL